MIIRDYGVKWPDLEIEGLDSGTHPNFTFNYDFLWCQLDA
jgi:hypothetical protein